MDFDFDRVIDRRGAHANKVEATGRRLGRFSDGALSMWVADMDFAAAPAVLDRLRAAVDHGVFGYYGGDESWRAAICDWMARRHGWTVEPGWITPSPGVCSAISVCIQAFSAPGEGVVLFSPVYHAFHRQIAANGRRVIQSPMRQEQGRYRMDLEALGRSLPDDARIVILCSPHNPGGAVWTRDELAALCAFCAERDLLLISDEIWHDLTLDDARHTVTALATGGAAPKLITCAAASKAFNLAGLHLGYVVIQDPDLRKAYLKVATAANIEGFNLMGALGTEAAYRDGADWLDAVRRYIAGNRDAFADGLARAVPGARAMPMAATYLAWVDFSGTGLAPEEAARRVREDARIDVNAGPSFGEGGESFARFNIACPRSVIDQALERLSDAFADLR
jgi:cystathionine beta-lyase